MDIDLSILRMLEREKEISFEVLAEAIEQALLTAYQRATESSHPARVELDRKSGHVTVWAREIAEDGTAGAEYDDTPQGFGRIAATTAKQVMLQRLRDAEDEIKRFDEYRERLQPYVVDQVPLIESAVKGDVKMLVEGANALMLDIDNGTYPFVTSSNTGLGGIFTGLHLNPRKIRETIGVVKAYTTRVGSGPFPTEQLNEFGDKLQQVGREFGVTTGRKRRCGWLDLVLVKYSNSINWYDSINLTKLDILDDFEEIQVAVAYEHNGKEITSFPADLSVLDTMNVKYVTLPGWKANTMGLKKWEDLPENARKYVEYIEKFCGVHIKYIGTGPGQENMIVR